MQLFLNKHIETIIDILKHHKVQKAYAFGSVVSDKFTEDSDIDILIYFDHVPFTGYADNYFDMLVQLENSLHRKIDLIAAHTLKNPYLISSIDNNKVLLFDEGQSQIYA